MNNVFCLCWKYPQVTIKAGETDSTLTEESVSYELENLICDLGGLAGLFLGMSFLTLLEFLNLFHDCLLLRIYQVNFKREKEVETAGEKEKTCESLESVRSENIAKFIAREWITVIHWIRVELLEKPYFLACSTILFLYYSKHIPFDAYI